MELNQDSEVIPEDLVKSFSDSVVAYNSGAVLASIVLLRAFIAKFARFYINANNGLKADDALVKYDESLPDSIRQMSPSLIKIYNNLETRKQCCEQAILFSYQIGPTWHRQEF